MKMTSKSVVFAFSTFFTFFTFSTGQAEPYLAAREAKSCLACHVSPSGAGVRNLEGREFSRAMAFPKNEADLQLDQPRLKVGEIPVFIGADVRASWLVAKNAQIFDQPQTAIYFHAAPTEELDVVLSADFFSTKEAYGLLKWGEAFALKAGRFTLPFGLLMGDPRSLLAQGSGFGTHVQDVGAEFNLHGRLDTSQYFLRGALTNGSGVGSRIRALTMQMGAQYEAYAVGLSGHLHKGDTGDRWRYGTFGWWRALPFVFLFELDSGREPVTDAALLLLHGTAEWNVVSGVQAGFSYEWWDADTRVTGDDRQRVAAKLRFFPLSYVECTVTTAVVSRPTFEDAIEGLLSLHFFY